MTDYIKLNEDTELQLFHTLFTGQTNLAGKTTAIRTLIPRTAKLGYTILVFDTKPTAREFSGYHDIPICYRPTTDALVLIGLLEAIFRRRITMYYGTLNRLTEDAKDIPDIIRNAEEMELKARSGFIKDACHTLADLLDRLRKELKGLNLSSKLELREGKINIMPLNEVSTEAQQLVIKTAFELTLKYHNRRTILVIDEAFRFLPQGYSSACKQAVQDVVTQGAKTQLYVWLATQFIATTEKDAIKAMANKLLGRQDDKTEIDATIDRTRDTHPKLRQNDLMTLKRGEFIFVPIDGPVKKVYVPIGAEQEVKPKPIEAPKVESRRIETPTIEKLQVEPQVEPIRTEAQPVEKIHLDEHQLVLEVESHERIVRVDDQTEKGMVIKVLWKAARPLSQSEIIQEAAEYGKYITAPSLSKHMSGYIAEGVIFQDGRQFRLPRFVRFDIKES